MVEEIRRQAAADLKGRLTGVMSMGISARKAAGESAAMATAEVARRARAVAAAAECNLAAGVTRAEGSCALAVAPSNARRRFAPPPITSFAASSRRSKRAAKDCAATRGRWRRQASARFAVGAAVSGAYDRR
jgi:hypothetical protein